MKNIKYYYALSDAHFGDYPREPKQFGADNSIAPIAFKSKNDRDEWVSSTLWCRARALTRSEAIYWQKRHDSLNYKPMRMYYRTEPIELHENSNPVYIRLCSKYEDEEA